MSNRQWLPTAETDLPDLMKAVKDDIFYTLNCIQVGTIQAYDPITNTASVTINFKRKLPDDSEIDYPILTDCPVFVLSGGKASFEMPIASGDQCIVLFADRSIDNWHFSGDTKAPDTARAHDIADGICLVGIRNLKTAKPTALMSVRLNAGDKKVSIKNDMGNLKLLIDALIDGILGLTVLTAGVPGTLNPASVALFTALKLQFALLLDEGLL